MRMEACCGICWRENMFSSSVFVGTGRWASGIFSYLLIFLWFFATWQLAHCFMRFYQWSDLKTGYTYLQLSRKGKKKKTILFAPLWALLFLETWWRLWLDTVCNLNCFHEYCSSRKTEAFCCKQQKKNSLIHVTQWNPCHCVGSPAALCPSYKEGT